MRGDEDKLFDELLRKSLENYQVPPPPGVWGAVKQKLFTRQNWQSVLFKGNTGLIGSISTGIVVTGLTAWYITGKISPDTVAQDTIIKAQTVMTNKDTVDQMKSVKEVQLYASSSNTATIEKRSTSEISDREDLTKSSDKSSAKSIVKNNSVKFFKTSHKNYTPAGDKKAFKQSGLLNSSDPFNDQTYVNAGLSAINLLTSLNTFELAYSGKGLFIDPYQISGMGRDEMLSLIKKDLRSHYDYARTTVNYSAGISASNDWRTSADDNCLPSSRFNANMFIRAKRDNLLFETGLGITRESATISNDTRFKPLLGTYYNLDSISFVYDSVNANPLPTYYYSTEYVYDSVERTSVIEKSKTYLYANIPVIAVYNFNFKRHNILFKTGIIFSFLLNKPESSKPESTSEKIITSSSESGIRKSYFSQWTVEANYEYLFSERLSLFIGPVYSAYLVSPFSDKQVRKNRDTYIGLKSGLLWNF